VFRGGGYTHGNAFGKVIQKAEHPTVSREEERMPMPS